MDVIPTKTLVFEATLGAESIKYGGKVMRVRDDRDDFCLQLSTKLNNHC